MLAPVEYCVHIAVSVMLSDGIGSQELMISVISFPNLFCTFQYRWLLVFEKFMLNLMQFCYYNYCGAYLVHFFLVLTGYTSFVSCNSRIYILAGILEN